MVAKGAAVESRPSYSGYESAACAQQSVPASPHVHRAMMPSRGTSKAVRADGVRPGVPFCRCDGISAHLVHLAGSVQCQWRDGAGGSGLCAQRQAGRRGASRRHASQPMVCSHLSMCPTARGQRRGRVTSQYRQRRAATCPLPHSPLRTVRAVHEPRADVPRDRNTSLVIWYSPRPGLARLVGTSSRLRRRRGRTGTEYGGGSGYGIVCAARDGPRHKAAAWLCHRPDPASADRGVVEGGGGLGEGGGGDGRHQFRRSGGPRGRQRGESGAPSPCHPTCSARLLAGATSLTAPSLRWRVSRTRWGISSGWRWLPMSAAV
jgi:hypothetical protein